jgi:AraC-like DNA-binding protein
VDALPGRTRATTSVAAQVQDVLRQRLDEPGLCAADVAATVGISVRTLHRAFAAQGAAFAGTLRSLRLARAAALLAQPRLDVLTTAEIGRRCGYADASHFVRDFQREHGATPARWRRARR